MKRYRYDQIEKAEPNVTRYKLYKAKTKWVVRGISSVAILFGVHEMGVNGVPQIVNSLTTTAHADTVADDSTSELSSLTDTNVTTVGSVTAKTTTSPVATTVATPINPLLGGQNTTANTMSQTVNPLTGTTANQSSNTTTHNQPAVSTTTNNTTPVADNQENAAQTVQPASDVSGNQDATPTKQVTDDQAFAANQKLNAKNEKVNQADVSQNATQEAKKVAEAPYDAEKTNIQQSAQSVLSDLQKVADEATAQAAANNQDRDVNNAAYSALQEHMAQEVNQINVALTAQSETLPKDLTTEALGLTQANKILTNMRQELDVAKQMMAADKAGYDSELVETAQNAMKQVVLPSGTSAKLDAYGDLIVSAPNVNDYQSVVNQLQQSGLIGDFRYVVDPTKLNYGLSGYTSDQILQIAKNTAVNNVLAKVSADLTMDTDANTYTESPFYDLSNITNYNIFSPYLTQLQKAYKSGTASEITLAAAEFYGAFQAYMNYNGGGGVRKNDDQQQDTQGTSIALVINVDENNNPIFTSAYAGGIQPGDILNSAGKVVNPATGNVVREFASPVGDPSGKGDGTYFVGKIGDAIPNPTKNLSIPNFTYVNTTGPTKLISIAGGQTTQIVVNHWTSGSASTTPATTALKATVGDVSKTADGNATFTTVPSVQLSGLTGVKTPTFAISDFDWSKVQATAGTYSITLNAAGIKKVTDANANTTLATTDVTAGKATINPATPKITVLKATVGDVSKTADGNTTFTTVPIVQLSGLTGVKTPTFAISDFDWSKVQPAAGTYAITLNAAGIKKVTDANANTTLVTSDVTAGTATIKPATPTITALKATVGNVSKTADGTTTFSTVPTVTLSGLTNAVVPTFTATDFDWSKVQPAAGTYDVTLNAAGIKKVTDANTNTTLATYDITAGKATINPAAPKITALKAVVGDVSKTADGNTTFTTVPTVQLSGLTGVKTPTLVISDFDWSKIQAAAGTYAITLNATGIKKVTDANANTTLATTDITAGKATINPATPKITVLKAIVGDVSKTADGNTTFTTVPTVQLSGLTGVKTPTFVISDFDWSKVQATAGTYAITLNAAGIKKVTDANANTTLATTDVTAGKATINPAAPKITALKATVGDVSKTADGSATFTTVPSVQLSGLTGVKTPTFAISDFDWSKVQPAAGTYAITLNAAGIKKVTDANANTTLATADVTSGKAIINPATPNTKALTATIGLVTKTYDGTTAFTDVPSVTLSDNATVPTLTTGDFDWSQVGKNVGTYAVTLTAAGIKKITDANPNTTLATTAITAGQAEIDKAPITINVASVTKQQGKPDPDLSILVNNQPADGDQVKFTYTRDPGEQPGTYAIKVVASAADNPNYEIKINNGSLTITATITALKASVGNVFKTYDGTTTFTSVPTVTINGLTGVQTPTFTTTDFDWSKVQSAAGSYAITLNAAGIKKVTDANANTTLATSDVTAGTATITPAAPTITALKATVGNVSKTADGTTTFSSVPTVTLSGLANAVMPTFTATDFDWSKVQPAAGSYAITLNAAGIKKVTDANANTTLATSDVTAVTATITPAAPTITALKAMVGNVSKTADGTTTFSSTPTVTLSGLANAVVPTFTATDFDWSKVQPAAGTYDVTLNATGIKKITDANANTTLAVADVTAGKAVISPVTTTTTALTATVGNVSKDFDGSATFTTLPTVTLGGLTNAVVPVFTTSDFDWSKVQAIAGTYAITLNAAGIKKVTDANPNTTLATADVAAGQVTIKPAAPTITALKATVGDVSKTYDGNSTFTTMPTVTLSGLANAVVPSFTATDFDWSKVQPAAGTYAVTLNAAGIKKVTDANANTKLAATDVTAGQATINPVALTATVGEATKTYDGTASFTTMPTVQLTGLTNATVPTLTTSDFDWSKVQPDAGSYAVTLNAAGIQKVMDANANTKLATADVKAGHTVINKASITISAKDGSKPAKTADPTLIATVSDQPTQGVAAKYTVSRDAGEAVGTYTIHVTAKDTDNPNYTITTQTGQFTITAVQAKASVDNVTKTYDGTVTFNKVPTVSLTQGFTATGLTSDDFDWSQVQANAGSYSVTLNAAGIQKLLSENPDMALDATAVTAGQATINKATVTVTAKDAGKVAGDPDPALTATVSDKPAKGAAVNYTVSRETGENVGSYTITVTPTTNANYTVNVKPGQFTITPEMTDVTVAGVTKTYDGATSFTSTPAVTITGAKDAKVPTLTAADFDWSNVQTNVGSYQVTLNADGKAKLQQQNPNISLNKVTAGTATITPAVVTLQAKDATKAFGANDPVFEATVTGQPENGAKIAYKVTRAPGENVGLYDLTVTPTANSNYQFTVTKGGQLTIMPAATSATISTVHKTYDGTTSQPTQVLSVTLANGTVINNLPASDFDWTAVGKDAGNYPVSLNAQGLQAILQQQPNYTLAAKDVKAGTVTVDPAPVTITAPIVSKDYDQKGYTGNLQAVVTGQPAAGVALNYKLTDVSADSKVGAYPINVILGTNDDYKVTAVTGRLTVNANNFKLTTNYVDAKNNALADATTTGNHNYGDAYTTSAKSIAGYYLTAKPANASGTFTDNQTVNYVYAPVGSIVMTTPDGKRTTIKYQVDGTDMTKVSVPTGEVVPYVNGYTAVSGTAKTPLTPVNAKDVTAGYQFPDLSGDPSQDTLITYVANTSTNGGNTNTGQTGTTTGSSTGTSSTPTSSSETNPEKVPTSSNVSQTGDTNQNNTNQNSSNQNTDDQNVKPESIATNGGHVVSGETVKHTDAGGTSEATNNPSALTSETASGTQQVVAKTTATTKTAPVKSSTTNQAKQPTLEGSAKTSLPQTGEQSNASLITEIGIALLGLFGLAGKNRKRRHE
ncbi:MAG TPA: hypothetical protein DDW71_04180 [Lactobacillus sp.]|nr:hypothetical protein [Lactobacillus sp.]